MLRANGGLSIVAAYLSRTLATLETIRAGMSLPSPLFRNEADIAVLNENFHLDRSSDPLRDLDAIIAVYRDIQLVVAHVPRGPNQKSAFGFIDAAKTRKHGRSLYGFCRAGAWKYSQGQTTEDGVRLDTVYLTHKVFTGANGIFQYVVLHEVAHFVGGRHGDIDCIRDQAYFHLDPARYERLSTYEAMTNADSYAQYAWQVNHRSHFRV